MSNREPTSYKFDALKATHEQVQQRLRQLGIQDDSTEVIAQAKPAGDPTVLAADARAQAKALFIAGRNQERERTRDARARVKALAPFDARGATSEQVAQRMAALGLRTDGLEPFRDQRQNVPPPPRSDQLDASAIALHVDELANKLVALAQSGEPIDVNQLPPALAKRYVELRYHTPGWTVAL